MKSKILFLLFCLLFFQVSLCAIEVDFNATNLWSDSSGCAIDYDLDFSQELNIKDKDLKQLQYLKTLAKKTDTIIVKDTIFVEDLTLDTTIQDTWHKTNIQLLYPSTIIINPEFISDKKIVTYLKKETIKPPKKCKFARAFQKKHKVIVVNIQENKKGIKTSI